MSDRVPPAAPCGADAPAAHRFGRFVLTALEGKSRRTMVWRAQDPQRGEPMLLVLPRERPADAAAVQAWLAGVRRAGRITHPHLAGLLEAGSVERWPYALYACGAGATLARLLADRTPSVIEAVRIIAAAAEGLPARTMPGWRTTICSPSRCCSATIMYLACSGCRRVPHRATTPVPRRPRPR